MSRRASGFSLIEVLLSVAIIAMLAGLSAPIYGSFQTRNDLDIAAQGVANALRRAQTYARGVSGDSQWGVEIQSTGATLFKGSVFASRPTALDELTSIPATITPSGTTEIIYTKLEGLPTVSGSAVTTPVSITLTSSANEIRTLTINAKGMVAY